MNQPTSTPAWPDLTLSAWEDTRDTLHLWTQIVGKVRLALEPMVNHWWQVALYVSARGLTTSLMPAGDGAWRSSSTSSTTCSTCGPPTASAGRCAWSPRTVATSTPRLMAALDDLGVDVTILARPVEVAEAIPFAEDDRHAAYDADAAQRLVAGARADAPGDDRVPGRLHRQGRARCTSSGAASTWPSPASPAARRPAPRRRPELRRLGAGAGLQPRGEQLRVLAGRERRGLLLRLRLSRARRVRGRARRRPPPRTTTRRWASSSSPTRRCGPPATPTRRCWRSSRAPTRPPPTSAAGTATRSRPGPTRPDRAGRALTRTRPEPGLGSGRVAPRQRACRDQPLSGTRRRDSSGGRRWPRPGSRRRRRRPGPRCPGRRCARRRCR